LKTNGILAACRERIVRVLLPPHTTMSSDHTKESPPGPPALRFSGVTKRYGGVAALDELALEIGRGMTFGLAGMNGAGKTTLIKCLLDFCAVDAGHIEIFGVPHRVTSSRSRLAFLPERFIPPYYLTGRDFLRYMLTLHGVQYAEADARDMLASLDLESSALGKPVRAFSKGMTQKLGLAACLLSGKDLYVLDEPTSGLDPKARALLKRRLRELGGRGHTVFFTSHALADVEEICDHMAVIHAGRLHFAGTPAELLARHGAGSLEDAFLACIEAAPAAAA
jgi:ABC-2 type transport system ATP-binding protein